MMQLVARTLTLMSINNSLLTKRSGLARLFRQKSIEFP